MRRWASQAHSTRTRFGSSTIVRVNTSWARIGPVLTRLVKLYVQLGSWFDSSRAAHFKLELDWTFKYIIWLGSSNSINSKQSLHLMKGATTRLSSSNSTNSEESFHLMKDTITRLHSSKLGQKNIDSNSLTRKFHKPSQLDYSTSRIYWIHDSTW